jgi:hypothetical protein
MQPATGLTTIAQSDFASIGGQTPVPATDDPATSAQSQPQSASIPLLQRGIDFPHIVNVSVGGGPSVPVMLDTGSIGLRILRKYVGPNVEMTRRRVVYGYESGLRYVGRLAYAAVTFPDADSPIATPPIGVQVIEYVHCPRGRLRCGFRGAMGVLGTRFYNQEHDEIFNPLAQLPGNLGSGYIVEVNETPHLVVGLTPENTQGFHFVRIEPRPVERQGRGIERAWEVKSIDACFSVNGGPSSCNVTSFDTGEAAGQFTLAQPIDPALMFRNGVLRPGQTVTMVVPGILEQTIVSGEKFYTNRYRITHHLVGRPPGFNSGAQVFRHFNVAYDYQNGRVGFAPAE